MAYPGGRAVVVVAVPGPRLPEEALTQPLRLVPACSARTVLPEHERRRAHAERWLEQVLAEWGLVPALAGRWLAAADTHLRTGGEIAMAAEYDAAAGVISLELWSRGRRLYGIDDWIG
jgi:hypothetical protein